MTLTNNKFILLTIWIAFFTILPVIAEAQYPPIGNEIDKLWAKGIPVDEPSWVGGGRERTYEKSEHNNLGGYKLKFYIDGELVNSKPYFRVIDGVYTRKWYAQFEPYHFTVGTHTIKSVSFTDHEILWVREQPFTVYEKSDLVAAGPWIRSVIKYDGYGDEPVSYSIISSIQVIDEDGLEDVMRVTLTFPDGTLIELTDEEFSSYGYNPAGDGIYVDDICLDYAMTGEFIFTAYDYEGHKVTDSYYLNEWLPRFDWVYPNQDDVVYFEELVFDWYYSKTVDYRIFKYEIRVYDESTFPEGFWRVYVNGSPVIYTGPSLEDGLYGCFFMAYSEKDYCIQWNNWFTITTIQLP